jgi:hypothetical protein
MSNKKTICQNFIEIVTVSSSSKLKFDTPIFTGNVGIGTSIARAALDIFSTDAILVPVGTDQQRPSTLVKGLLRYNTTEDKFEGYSGSSWTSFGSSTNTVNITSVSATSDGWTVTTDNGATADDFQVHVTLVDETISSYTKGTPNFTSAGSITTSTDKWPDGAGWSVSANVDNNNAWKAFNSTSATDGWTTDESGVGDIYDDYITVEYPTQNILRSVVITCREFNTIGSDPKTIYINGSNDGVNFTGVQSFIAAKLTPAQLTNPISRTFTITNPHIPYSHWQIYLYDSHGKQDGRVKLSVISFNTGLSTGQIILKSAYSLNKTEFKIVMTDDLETPLSMINPPSIFLKYNIIITKAGNIVSSGLYQFNSNNTFSKLTFSPYTTNYGIFNSYPADHYGAYSLCRLTNNYTGPAVRVIKSNDSAIYDIWFNEKFVALKALSTTGNSIIFGSTYTLEEWRNGATLSVIILYDQYSYTPYQKNLTVPAGATQPIVEFDTLLNSYAIRFDSTDVLVATNHFGTNTISEMTFYTRVHELIRTENVVAISYNGTAGVGADTTNPPFGAVISGNGGVTWKTGGFGIVNNNNETGGAINISGGFDQQFQLIELYRDNTYTTTVPTSSTSAPNCSGGLRIGSGYIGYFKYLITGPLNYNVYEDGSDMQRIPYNTIFSLLE